MRYTIMKRKRNLIYVAAITLFVIFVAGLGFQLIAQSEPMAKQMDKQMDMMKKMMMNSPKAMKKADQAVQKQKAEAMKKGKYVCCLKAACDVCALKMGECPCGMNVAQGKPVCNECKGGWYAGNGAIDGKTADQIMTMPRMKMKM